MKFISFWRYAWLLSALHLPLCGAAATLDGAVAPMFSPSDHSLVVSIMGPSGIQLSMQSSNGQHQTLTNKGVLDGNRSVGGFLVRDVATSDTAREIQLPIQIDGNQANQEGDLPELALHFQANYEAFGEGFRVSGVLEDRNGKDRAISLYYVLGSDPAPTTWFEDVRHSRPIPQSGEMAPSAKTPAGATGTFSSFPLCAFGNDQNGTAIGVPMNQPAIYRMGYNADSKVTYLVFDFGLSKISKKPSRAEFSFILFPFDAQIGYRSALQNYYKSYPEQFSRRTKAEGIWLYADPLKIKDPKDFGFMFHEFNDRGTTYTQQLLKWDDAAGIMSFRYHEPMSLYVNIPNGTARNYETMMEALRKRQQARGPAQLAALAQDSCGVRNEDQTFWHDFADLPWVHGARLIQSPDPGLPNTPDRPNRAHLNYDPADAKGYYKNTGKQFEPQEGMDGDYHDSLSLFANRLDFAKEHLAESDYPLTFSHKTRTPCLVLDWAITEYCKWVAEDLHSKGKLTFANGQPGTFLFMCPYLDVMGREVKWHKGKNGELLPDDDRVMNFRRAVCATRPFLMALNDDYTQPEAIERYFKTALFYGFYPSMFVNFKGRNGKAEYYFSIPEYVNRDRPLFIKYIPLIRQVAMAGWQPLTGATCSSPDVWLERFGPLDPEKDIYLTVMNSADLPNEFTINLQDDVFASRSITEVISQKQVEAKASQLKLQLSAHEVAVLKFARP